MDGACFVCHDHGGTTFTVCRCNVRVHSECFLHMVRHVPAHSRACPVCTHTYHRGPPPRVCLCFVGLIALNAFSISMFVLCFIARSRAALFFLVYSIWNTAEMCVGIRLLRRTTVVLGAAAQQRHLRRIHGSLLPCVPCEE